VYVETKRAAVAAVNEGVAAGLNAVIVHPGFMLGPWDWKPSSGQMMLEVGSGWRPLSPRGGCSLCDARDVAAGVIAALHADCPSGRQYILAGHNWTYQRLWTEMARRMGRRSPLRPIGPGIEFLAGWLGDSWGRLSGKEPLVNSASAAMSGQFHWYDSGRAAKELGYRIRDAEETLDAAAAWLQERFVLPRRVPAR
jgi:dihydroflavonol-4-reductase